MPLVVSIHQPAYLPWLGYLDRIQRSDVFVFLDNVQFQRNSFQNRNKVRTAQGWTWLTVPLLTKGHTGGVLADIAIDPVQHWQRKHLATIAQSYAGAPFHDRVMSWLAPFYGQEWSRLADLCWAMLEAHLKQLGITTRLVRARDMEDHGERKSHLVLDLCRQLGATAYISGPQGRGYIDEASFASAGIELRYDDYRHPVYQQVHGGFESHMAAIDLMMNVEDPMRVLKEGSP
ncbi:MAG: WbqC family protein [Xanthobacteraceae bacterium]|nr:WbqC family protein [Xanthobacteraceae bacterium]